MNKSFVLGAIAAGGIAGLVCWSFAGGVLVFFAAMGLFALNGNLRL